MTDKSAVRTLATFLVLSAFMAATWTAAQTAKSQQNSGSCLSLSLSAVHNTVKVGEPILVNIRMVFHCDRSDIQPYAWYYFFNVRDGEGNLALSRLGRVWADPQHNHPAPGDIEHLRAADGRSKRDKQIARDETVNFNDLTVADLWDLSKPGSYTISVHRQDAYGKIATSNEITVTVVP